jgi:hypothetical protein
MCYTSLVVRDNKAYYKCHCDEDYRIIKLEEIINGLHYERLEVKSV